MELSEIQERLRESIKNSSHSQKEIAYAVGVSAQTISKYMRENIFPALDTLSKLCAYLDVSADYILGLRDFKEISEIKLKARIFVRVFCVRVTPSVFL